MKSSVETRGTYRFTGGSVWHIRGSRSSLSPSLSLSLIPLNWGPLLASAELPICDRWPKQAWGFLCFALGSATHRARCLTSLSLKVSPGPPRLLQITSLRSQGSQVLLRVFEVLSGDAGDLPFYGWKRMAHSGLTLLSLPFSLSLSHPSQLGPSTRLRRAANL